MVEKVFESILEELKKKLSVYYGIKENFDLEGNRLSIFAEYKAINQKYIVAKPVKLYSYDTFGYVLIVTEDFLNKEALNKYTKFVESIPLKLINPTIDHMSTSIHLLILAKKIDEIIIPVVNKSYKSRSIFFGLKGWYETHILAYDFENDRLYFPEQAKQIALKLKPTRR